MSEPKIYSDDLTCPKCSHTEFEDRYQPGDFDGYDWI